MGSCAAPSAKGDDKFITTDYLQQCPRKNKTAINIEYMKASIRAKVEHPFRIIKRQFGFVKARYKGLLKNDNQLAMLFTLANLFRVDQMIRQWERSQ